MLSCFAPGIRRECVIAATLWFAGTATAVDYVANTDADQLTITRNGVVWQTGSVVNGKASFVIPGNWVLNPGDSLRGTGALPASFTVGNDFRIASGAKVDFSGVTTTPGAGGGTGGAGGSGGGGGSGGTGGQGGGVQWVRGGGAFAFFFGAVPPPIPAFDGLDGTTGGDGNLGSAGTVGGTGSQGFQNLSPVAQGGAPQASQTGLSNGGTRGRGGDAAPYPPSPLPGFIDGVPTKNGGNGTQGTQPILGVQGETGGTGHGGGFLPATDNTFDLVAGNGGGGGAGGQGGQGGGGGGGGGGGASGQGNWATVLVPPLPPLYIPGWNFAGFGGSGGAGSDGGDGGTGATGATGGAGGAGGGAAEFFAQGRIIVEGTAEASGGAGAQGQNGFSLGVGEAGADAEPLDNVGNALAIVPINGIQTYPFGVVGPGLPGGFGGIGSTGRSGGFGGLGGDGGNGGGGSGGTIKFVGTDVKGSGLIDVSGGLGADDSVSFDDGEDGRFLVGTNTSAAGSSAIGALGGATLRGNNSQTQAGTLATNPLIAEETFVPTIAGLNQGAEAFGLTSLNTLDLLLDDGSSLIQATPQNAFAGVARYDVGPAGFGLDYGGYDLLLVYNARGETLTNPMLGITTPDAASGDPLLDPFLDIGRESFLTDLLDGGWATDARFGGTGDLDFDSFAGFGVYATLIPEDTDYLFNFAVTSGETILSAERQTLANGELFFVTSSPDVPVVDATWSSTSSVPGNWSDSVNWAMTFADTGLPPTGAETPGVPGTPGNSADYAFNVFIDQDVDVNADVSVTVDQLNIGVDDALTITTGNALAVERFAVRTDSGKINNDGEIVLNGANGSTTRLLISGSGLMLDGNGTLRTTNNPNNIIGGIRPGDSLIQFNNHTIQAAGELGNDTLAMTNHGTITALSDGAGGRPDLVIDPDGDATRSRAAFVNHGTLNTLPNSVDVELRDGFFHNAADGIIDVRLLTFRDARVHNDGEIRFNPGTTSRLNFLGMTMLTGNDIPLDDFNHQVHIEGGFVNETTLGGDIEISNSAVVNYGGQIGGPDRLVPADSDLFPAPFIEVTNSSITGGILGGDFRLTNSTLKDVTLLPSTSISATERLDILGLAGVINNQIDGNDPSLATGMLANRIQIVEDATFTGNGWSLDNGFEVRSISGSGDTQNPNHLLITAGTLLSINDSLGGGTGGLTLENHGEINADDANSQFSFIGTSGQSTDATPSFRNAGVVRAVTEHEQFELSISGGFIDNTGGLIETNGLLDLSGRFVGGTLRAAEYRVFNTEIDGSRIESLGGPLFFTLDSGSLRIDNTTIAADTTFEGEGPSESFVTIGNGVTVETPSQLEFSSVDVSFEADGAFTGDGKLVLAGSHLSSPGTLRFGPQFTVEALALSEIGTDGSVIENLGTIRGRRDTGINFILNPRGFDAYSTEVGLINRGLIENRGIVEGGVVDNRDGVLQDVDLASLRVIGGTVRDIRVQQGVSSEFGVGDEDLAVVFQDTTLEGNVTANLDAFIEFVGSIENNADFQFGGGTVLFQSDARFTGNGRMLFNNTFFENFADEAPQLTNEAGHTIEFTGYSELDLTDLVMPEIINFGTVLFDSDVVINEFVQTRVLPAGSVVPDLSNPDDLEAVRTLTEDTAYDALRIFKNAGTLEIAGSLRVQQNAIENEGLINANGITLDQGQLLSDVDATVDLNGRTLTLDGQSTFFGGSLINANVSVVNSSDAEPAAIAWIDFGGGDLRAFSPVDLGGEVTNIGTLRIDSNIGDVPVVRIGADETAVDANDVVINRGKVRLSAGKLATDTFAFAPSSTQTTPSLAWTGGTFELRQQTFGIAPGGVFGDRVDLNAGMTLDAAQGVSIATGGALGLGEGALVTPSIANSGTLELGLGDAAPTLAAAVSRTGVVRKIGTGTTSLMGPNTYTGQTQLLDGWLQVDTADALGAPTSQTVFQGGNLRVTGPNTGASQRTLVLASNTAEIDVADPTAIFEALVAPGAQNGVLVSKSGTGTWRHAGGLNLPQGALTVNDGTFDANGADINLSPTGNSQSGGTVNASGGEVLARRLFANGTTGNNGGTSQNGGRGGNGGFLNILDGRVVVTSQISLTGGDGGNGGNGPRVFGSFTGPGGSAGSGGRGGSINVNNGGEFVFTSVSIDLSGGQPGQPGQGNPNGFNGFVGNSGRLNVSGGTLVTNRSRLDFSLDGGFQFASGTIRFVDGNFLLGSSTRLNQTMGSTVKTLTSTRSLAFDSTLTISAGQTLRLTGGGLTAGTIDHRQGGTFLFQGGELAVGTFDGDLTQFFGTLHVGNRVNQTLGLTAVTGAYNVTNADLAFELGGLTRGVNHDALNINGAFDLTGTDIDLAFVDGFAPQLGDAFTLVEALNITGTFDDIGGLIIDDETLFAVTYTDTEIIATAALPGDTNLDGQIDQADLQALADAFDQTGTWADGDLNADGFIDLDDLTILGSSWGRSTAATDIISFSEAITEVGLLSVPEPATALLLIGGALGLTQRRRH